jgi:hypothetical protein
MVTIRSAAHPSAIAFCRNAYWRVADSVLVSTCRSVDHVCRIRDGTTQALAADAAARLALRGRPPPQTRRPHRHAHRASPNRMNDNTLRRVEQACIDLLDTGEQVTFTAVAARTGLSRCPNPFQVGKVVEVAAGMD